MGECGCVANDNHYRLSGTTTPRGVVTVVLTPCIDGCGHVYPVRQIGTPPAPCLRCGEVPSGGVDVHVQCDEKSST